MNPLNFVAVILKVLLANLFAALNFANVFLKIKKTFGKLKNVKKRKKRDQNKKKHKNVFFTSMGFFTNKVLPLFCTRKTLVEVYSKSFFDDWQRQIKILCNRRKRDWYRNVRILLLKGFCESAD